MENLKRYESNLGVLQEQLENTKQEYETRKVEIEQDNTRLEGMKKTVDPAIKSSTLLDTINNSNQQIDKEIENNKRRLEMLNNKVEKAEQNLENGRIAFKEAIFNNRKEAAKNKSKAYVEYAKVNRAFTKNIEKGKEIKLKLKAYQSDKNNSESYKAASKEQADHMNEMKALAKQRNELWKKYNEASKEEVKVLAETQALLEKYNLQENEREEENPQPRKPEQGSAEQGEPEEEPKVSVKLGRKGEICYGDKTYKVSKKAIREGLRLNNQDEKEIKKYLTKILEKMDEKSLDSLVQEVKEGSVDLTVLNSIFAIDAPLEERDEICKRYINSVNGAKEGKENQNPIEVTYDMNDVSKANLWNRIFRREIDANDKQKMFQQAVKAERYGVGKIEGEYEPSRVESIINFAKEFFGRETPKMPIYKQEDMAKVFEQYQDLKHDSTGKVKEKNQFKEDLRVAIEENRNMSMPESELLQDMAKNDNMLEEDQERGE